MKLRILCQTQHGPTKKLTCLLGPENQEEFMHVYSNEPTVPATLFELLKEQMTSITEDNFKMEYCQEAPNVFFVSLSSLSSST